MIGSSVFAGLTVVINTHSQTKLQCTSYAAVVRIYAPQIRSHDFWRYINLYVCMYMYAVHLLRANKKLINNVNIVICQFNSSQLNFILDEQ